MKDKLCYIPVLVTGIYLLFFLSLFLLPHFSPLTEDQVLSHYHESYRIYDRNGQLIREAVNPEGNRAYWIDLEDVDPFIIQAILSAEDRGFYKHHGISISAMTRAFFSNLIPHRLTSGASTLSMQLGRIYGQSPRTIWGKFQQIYLARRLEVGLTKDQILEFYLNMVPYGRGTMGIEAASYAYFNGPHNLLSHSQQALMAGMIQAPSYYDPEDNNAGARDRRNYVISRMVEDGVVDQDSALIYKGEPIMISPYDFEPKAMHFTDYVVSQLDKGGSYHTSLDSDLNEDLQSLVKTHIQKMYKQGIEHAAVVVIDNSTMEIRAMVGSPDYWDGEEGSNNGAITYRQPGSALKPFTYALAFESGFQPGDVIPDIPINYAGAEGRLYEPQNITGKFSGPVMLQEALVRSLNIPAIELANEVGIDNLLKVLRSVGFANLTADGDYYGLGLTLGNGEVTLLELAHAYTTFANKGVFYPLNWHEFDKGRGKPIFEESTAFLITDIISNDMIKMRAFGTNNPLIFDFPISIKTGTSNNWKDNWTVGYTDQYTVAVWAGSFSGQPNNQYSATQGVGPLFHQVASLVESYYGNKSQNIWKYPPYPVHKVELCPLSGLPPNEDCPVTIWTNTTRDYDAEGGGLVCDVHKAVTIDTLTNLPVPGNKTGSHYVKKVFEYLPAIYAQWEADMGRTPPPDLSHLGYTSLEREQIQIAQPRDGDIFIFEPGYNPETQSIKLQALIPSDKGKVSWYVNDQFFEAVSTPFVSSLPTKPGHYRIQARMGQLKSKVISIDIK